MRDEDDVTRDTAGEVLFIVDWDIPAKPTTKRRMFYYYVKALMRARGKSGHWSSMSVMITKDEDLASTIYHLASRYGKAHLYKAKKVK